MAARRPYDGPSVVPGDGRLDLDSLDLTTDLENLDVIGEERPTPRERLVGWLEPTGLLPFLARHRALATTTAVVVALALVAGTVWWVRRPTPLPAQPHVFARAAGADPTASLVLDPGSGVVAGVRQNVLVSSAEAPGVALRLVGVTGPGLAPDPALPGVDIDLSRTDRPVMVGAALACTAPASTTAALQSGPGDYALDLQRTAPGGDVRTDRVPLVGSATLVDLVHRACLQIAADRDLRVTGLVASAVPGVVAVNLDVTIDNSSARSWTGLHVAAAAQPVVTNDGREVQLEPGTTGHLRARLWPTDCADPGASLRKGISVDADLGPDGRPPSESSTTSTVQLRVGGPFVDQVVRVAAGICGTEPPRGTVSWARLREGGGQGSAGIVDFGLTVTAPGVGIVEIDHLGDVEAYGEVFAFQSPAHVIDGTAAVTMQWRTPSCQTILDNGLPVLHVVLAGDVRRPYLVPMSGEALRPVLARLCGAEVAALA